MLPLIVVSGDGPALFGRNWLREIQLDWGSIQKLSALLEDILEKYTEVFRPELGELQGIEGETRCSTLFLQTPSSTIMLLRVLLSETSSDYKVTINPELNVDQYPVPTAEDLFAMLAGGQ